MTTTSTSTYLVLGGSGKSGSRVARRLAGLGHHVRTVSRSTSPRFDWDDETTWPAAVAGASAAYLTYYPDISFPGAAARIGAFARTAVDAGVTRLVLLSGRGEPDAVPAEDAVRESGADWTLLRCAWFMQNFSEHFLLGPVLDGVVALPAGEVREPFVDLDDVAEVAVCALTRGGHQGRTYELTGPELLGFRDVAAELSRVTGRDIAYHDVSAEDYAVAATAAGVPPEEVAPLTELFARVLDGHNAHCAADLARLLDRPPGRFAEYAERAVRTGVWQVPAPARV